MEFTFFVGIFNSKVFCFLILITVQHDYFSCLRKYPGLKEG